jgi:hypothetical protein
MALTPEEVTALAAFGGALAAGGFTFLASNRALKAARIQLEGEKVERAKDRAAAADRTRLVTQMDERRTAYLALMPRITDWMVFGRNLAQWDGTSPSPLLKMVDTWVSEATAGANLFGSVAVNAAIKQVSVAAYQIATIGGQTPQLLDETAAIIGVHVEWPAGTVERVNGAGRQWLEAVAQLWAAMRADVGSEPFPEG